MISETNLRTPTNIATSSTRDRIPIHLYVNDAIKPDPQAQLKLERLAESKRLDHYVVALPDIHAKARNPAPTGSVVVSRDHIVPMAVDKGINCGMRMILSNLQADALSTTDLDQIFTRLAEEAPGRAWDTPKVDAGEMLDILLRGSHWASERYGIPQSELQNMERNGAVFDDNMLSLDVDKDRLRRVVPAEVFKKGGKALGTLGGGNHFFEMQEVVEILDAEKAARLGIRPGQVVFMLHTGSRHVGSTIMRYYSNHAAPDAWRRWWKLTRRKAQFHMQDLSLKDAPTRLRHFHRGAKFYGLPVDSEAGQRMLIALHAGYNFGFVNRMVLTESLRRVLRETLATPDLDIPLLYDCAHVSIQPETHLGERLWVHRHGASQARPASAFSEHPIYAETGQPVPIPGSMGDDSYIGVAAEGVAHTFHSVNHGAGRLFDKPEAKEHFNAEDVQKSLGARNIRLYRAGKGDLAEQAPRSFKDISAIVQTMHKFNLANMVARVRPIAVLKG